MALELMPQLARIELPDAWGQRVDLLADWTEQNGDMTRAEQLRDELNRAIPDFGEN
jgi:hypothetical protein